MALKQNGSGYGSGRATDNPLIRLNRMPLFGAFFPSKYREKRAEIFFLRKMTGAIYANATRGKPEMLLSRTTPVLFSKHLVLISNWAGTKRLPPFHPRGRAGVSRCLFAVLYFGVFSSYSACLELCPFLRSGLRTPGIPKKMVT